MVLVDRSRQNWILCCSSVIVSAYNFLVCSDDLKIVFGLTKLQFTAISLWKNKRGACEERGFATQSFLQSNTCSHSEKERESVREKECLWEREIVCLCVGELSEEWGGVFWSLLLRFLFHLASILFFAKQSQKFSKFGGHLICKNLSNVFLVYLEVAFQSAICCLQRGGSLFFSFLSCDTLHGKTWALFFSVCAWHFKICNTTASISINVIPFSKEIMNYAFQNGCYHCF